MMDYLDGTDEMFYTPNQEGILFGEAVADLIASGFCLTDILSTVLAEGPMDLREARAAARSMHYLCQEHREFTCPEPFCTEYVCQECAALAHP